MTDIPKLNLNKWFLDHYKRQLPIIQERNKMGLQYEAWILEQIKIYEGKIENTENHKNATDTSGH